MAKIVWTGPEFPIIPSRWGQEERRFALGIRDLFEYVRSSVWQRAWPVGSVILTTGEEKPFTFGSWEEIETGITDVTGWKRVK